MLSPSLTPKQYTAIIGLARQEAVGAVKRELHRQRQRRLHSTSRRELTILADEYIAGTGPTAEAKEIVERWRCEGFFGKRAMRAAAANELLAKYP
jgi:hypothetical protein